LKLAININITIPYPIVSNYIQLYPITPYQSPINPVVYIQWAENAPHFHRLFLACKAGQQPIRQAGRRARAIRAISAIRAICAVVQGTAMEGTEGDDEICEPWLMADGAGPDLQV